MLLFGRCESVESRKRKEGQSRRWNVSLRK